MKSNQLLAVLVAAGAFGAVTGGAVGAFAQRPESAPDAVLMERLDDLARSVDGLRAAAGEAGDDVADLRERLVAVELELGSRPTPVVRAPDAGPVGASPDAAPDEFRDAPTRRARATERGVIDIGAAAAHALDQRERLVKGLRIRALPEDERWQHAADTLRLNSVQVDEIRAAHDELQDGLKAAVVEETTESDGSVTTFRRVDGSKMREAQQAFQARVDNTLTDEQKSAWRDEGFADAFGRRSGVPNVVIRANSIRIGSESGGSGGVHATGNVEIVTTEAIREDEKDD